jgi:hypothetical protein
MNESPTKRGRKKYACSPSRSWFLEMGGKSSSCLSVVDFAVEPFGVREQKKLSRLKELKTEWDAANPGGHAEQFMANLLLSRDLQNREDVLWYVVRRLSEPYIWQGFKAGRIRRHVLMIDENRRLNRMGVRIAADFIAQCKSKLCGVITLNYDLLIEYALGSRGFNYGKMGEILKGRGPYPVSQWRNPVTLTGEIHLAKLHGSISWDKGSRYTDGRRGLTGKALIVAPTPEKRPPNELRDQWDLSTRILNKASRILVFGFAFNDYDEAVLTHLRESGKNLEEAAIVDICSREDAARHLRPKSNIRSFQPPSEKLEEIQAWLRK